MANSPIWGAETPESIATKFLHIGCRPWRNHACRFRRRSVKGFWRGEGSNFGLFQWLAFVTFTTRSHYRASVWYGAPL